MRMPVALLLGIVVSWVPQEVSGWPAMYSDCSIFPTLGEPQNRPQQHPAMALICEPHAPATFEYCMTNCSVVEQGGKQNCSTALCTCTEHCMNSEDVCTTNITHPDPSHRSLPDALAAKPGHTGLMLDGAAITAGTGFVPGRQYMLTVSPSNNTSLPSWFLLDAGIGVFTVMQDKPSKWTVTCDGSRASFMTPRNAPVELLWMAPLNATGPVALRVAEATSMGNLTVNAAVLNASTRGLAPATEIGFVCAVAQGLRPGGGPPTRQCMSVPLGTVGGLTKAACETECFAGQAGDVYRCLRCDHIYMPASDGVAFEALPDDWVCPVCGAPKAAYANQTAADGTMFWSHSDEDAGLLQRAAVV